MFEDGPVEEEFEKGKKRSLNTAQIEHGHEASKEHDQQLLSVGGKGEEDEHYGRKWKKTQTK